jgi:hypothetical protein
MRERDGMRGGFGSVRFGSVRYTLGVFFLGLQGRWGVGMAYGYWVLGRDGGIVIYEI